MTNEPVPVGVILRPHLDPKKGWGFFGTNAYKTNTFLIILVLKSGFIIREYLPEAPRGFADGPNLVSETTNEDNRRSSKQQQVCLLNHVFFKGTQHKHINSKERPIVANDSLNGYRLLNPETLIVLLKSGLIIREHGTILAALVNE